MNQYLFLCSGGKKRSPTAAFVASEIAKKNGRNITADYGSLEFMLQLDSPKLRNHLQKYDNIFVMEEYMTKRLSSELKIPKNKIICLNIEDKYEPLDNTLIDILYQKLILLMTKK